MLVFLFYGVVKKRKCSSAVQYGGPSHKEHLVQKSRLIFLNSVEVSHKKLGSVIAKTNSGEDKKLAKYMARYD